ncbi:MAG: glycoside hydrolase family 95 protein [Clostridiales bacterium]|jgi:alpha-L-fucosidase 2|nr:glycoside hydrolase family 95 protein [Clostridiales bacterium]
MNIRKPKTALKFKRPSQWWSALYRGAIPAGNGKTGAAVYGGAGADTVLLTHGDLWWQGHGNVLPDVADKIKDVKRLLSENRLKDAEYILSNALVNKGYRPRAAVPLPVADFKITMPLSNAPREYMRVLNMENGEISVTYRDGSTKYERSLFVSREQDLICLEITKSGGKAVDVGFSLDVHDKTAVRMPAGVSKTPEGVTVKYEPFFAYYSARSDSGAEFGAVANIKYYGGMQEVKDNSIQIKGADRVLVLIKLFVESQREKEWKNLRALLTGIKLPYDKLLKEHSQLHARLFNSAELELEDQRRDWFVEDLLDDARENGASQALIEKLWAYGRYLMISATDEKARPMAQYGLWCGDYAGVNSELRFDETLQTMYAHTFAGNLNEFSLAVFAALAPLHDDFKKNSARLFGTRGIMVPATVAPGGGLVGSVDPKVLHTTYYAAAVARLFYDYYLFTGDVKFLKNTALPFMKDAVLFYEEFFKVRDDGKYETVPSYSPDNTPASFVADNVEIGIAKNATVDFAAAKDLLKNIIAASETAHANKDEIPKWKDMLTRIPAYAVNEDGALSEYADAKLTDNYAARTLPHLYPAFPGNEFGEQECEMAKPALAAAKRKMSASLQTATSNSWARLANVFLRLSDVESAMELINNVVRVCVMDNLVTAENDWRGTGLGVQGGWAAYDLEGNLGLTNAVQEMLVQSTPKFVKILPALPESFARGSVSGLLTRAGAEVDMEWDRKKGNMTLKLKCKRSNMIDVKLPAGVRKYKGPLSEAYNPETGLIRNLELPAGKTLTFEMKL